MEVNFTKYPQNHQKPVEILKPNETIEQKLITQALKQGAKMFLDEDNLFSLEFKNTTALDNFLLCLYKKGYVFHGSSRRIDILKPHQANCEVKQDGNLKAIYFTNLPIIAKFCAITGGIEGCNPFSVTGKFDEENNKFNYTEASFAFSDEPAESGYVYVVPNNKLVQCRDDNGNSINEFVSIRKIKPVLRIKIKKIDFPFEIEQIPEN